MKKLAKKSKARSRRKTAEKKALPLPEAGNKQRFERLLDDAVFGIQRRK
jgi:hypothetical protein